nr:flippase-like domain-containing protein [Confluentibacter lentus]
MYSLLYKSKQIFFALIKISIVVGAFYFIYAKLIKNDDLIFSVFCQFLIKNKIFSPKNVFFLIVLSIFNWFFEILKWQYLVSEIKKIKFKTALQQSLGALTVSLLTPNRIGEYGAKAIFYNKEFRKRILLINLMSNVMQMSTTCIFGVIGFWFFTSKYALKLDYYKLTLGLLFIIFAFSLGAYIMKKSKFTIKGFSLEKLKVFIKIFNKKTIFLGFLFSLIRYLVFSFQFYFLLHIFKVEISYLNAMMVISSMYFLSSIIPTISFFDVVIKGSVALYLFSFVGVDELVILNITTLMWLLNFVLPSLVGSYFVLNFKYPREND